MSNEKKEKIGMTVFKVFFQEQLESRIIREQTRVRYFEAESETAVRQALKHENYNVEFVQALSPSHLQYEAEHNDDFKVEKL